MPDEIVRLWTARAERGKLEAYLHHFRAAVQPELAALPGYLGATVLWNADADAGRAADRGVSAREAGAPESGELVVMTRWRSMDAVRAFAGADPTRAVVGPAAAAVLEAFDRHVRHYAVVLDAPGRQATA